MTKRRQKKSSIPRLTRTQWEVLFAAHREAQPDTLPKRTRDSLLKKRLIDINPTSETYYLTYQGLAAVGNKRSNDKKRLKWENKFAELWEARGNGAVYYRHQKSPVWQEKSFAEMYPCHRDGTPDDVEIVKGFYFDFVFPRYRVAVEIHGGVWMQGRHNRGGGFILDQRKITSATANGWRVCTFTSEDLRKLPNSTIHQVTQAMAQQELYLPVMLNVHARKVQITYDADGRAVQIEAWLGKSKQTSVLSNWELHQDAPQFPAFVEQIEGWKQTGFEKVGRHWVGSYCYPDDVIPLEDHRKAQ